MTEENKSPEEAQPDKHYRVKNVKYGEKTVVGRVVGRNKTVIRSSSGTTGRISLHK